MNTNELKHEAREAGLDWTDVRCLYCELRENELYARERKWTLRAEAFERSGYGMHFKAVYRKAFTTGDHSEIPCFDGLAASMTYEFPELNAYGDPAAALYEVLCEPQDLLPPASETYRQAIEILSRRPRPSAADRCPF